MKMCNAWVIRGCVAGCLGAAVFGLACSDGSDTDRDVGSLSGAGGSAGNTTSTAGASGAPAAGVGGSGSGASASAGGVSGSSNAAGASGSVGAGGGASVAADAGAVEPSGDASAPIAADAGAAVAFALSSPAFDDVEGCGPGDAADVCDFFPNENTGLGDDTPNVSPAFDWVGVPEGTQSFAIAMHDLSFLMGGDPFTHWVMWNIPGSETGLPAELPGGAMPGVPAANTQQTSFRPDDSFAGSGACGNVYEIVLYALGTPTFTPSNPNSADQVEAELEASDAVLGTARMRGRSDPAGPC